MENIINLMGDILIFLIILPIISVLIITSNHSAGTRAVMLIIPIIIAVAIIIHVMKKAGLKKEDR